ncbi:MAG TPA: hypothetical protein DDW76_29605 [Cyanobacteria bacterium UBA11369]|nr:hypothetical protein [Cyanobacteria bacterium UBA11371]HBE34818.1 hypothetical protein [Cyanobacteria bacterium UBA11368]HBE52803.1 hypothetical protein [Cyanobacteria bacterium UBA11369]
MHKNFLKLVFYTYSYASRRGEGGVAAKIKIESIAMLPIPQFNRPFPTNKIFDRLVSPIPQER